MPYDTADYYQTSGNSTATLNNFHHMYPYTSSNSYNCLKKTNLDHFNSLTDNYNSKYYSNLFNGHSYYSTIKKQLATQNGCNQTAGQSLKSTAAAANSAANPTLSNHSINSSIKANGFLTDKRKESAISEAQPKKASKEPKTMNSKQQTQPPPPEVYMNGTIESTKSQSNKDLNNNIGPLNDCSTSNSLCSLANVNLASRSESSSNESTKLLSNGLTDHLTTNLITSLANELSSSTGFLNTTGSTANLNGLGSSLSSNLSSHLCSSLRASLNNLNAILNVESSSIGLSNSNLNDGLLGSQPFSSVVSNGQNQQIQLNQQINQIQLNNNYLSTSNSAESMKSILSFANSLNKKSLDSNKNKKQILKLFNQPGKPGDLQPLDNKMDNLFCEPIKKICKVCGDRGNVYRF